MNASQVISTISSLLFLAMIGYGLYLLWASAQLQREQQATLNKALIDSIKQAQHNTELAAGAAQKLAEIIYLFHSERLTENNAVTSHEKTVTKIPTTEDVLDTPAEIPLETPYGERTTAPNPVVRRTQPDKGGEYSV